MDTVFINGLSIETIIGCYDYEKSTPQKIVIDLEMAWDIQKAANSDLLSDTLDYDAVRKRIERLASEERFELVESLAEAIAQTIQSEFSVRGVKLRLAKPEAIANTVDVGVVIARGIQF